MKKTLFLAFTLGAVAFAAPAYGQQSPGRPASPELRANWAAGARLMAAASGPRQAVDVGEEAGSKAAAALKGYAGRLDESEIERRGRAAAAKAGILPPASAGGAEKQKRRSKAGGVVGSPDDFVRGYVAGFVAAAK
jgi:hypothetical protein